MNYFKTIFLLLALLAVHSLDAKVVTYPAGIGVKTLNVFSVEVRQGSGQWLPVDVYPVKVDRVDDKGHNVEVASMAYFDFDGTVDVRVISNEERVKSARVRPLSCKIAPNCVGDTVTFSLSHPRNLSVEINGDIFHNLHLFANPIDKFRPSDKEIKRALKKKKGGNLIYFAPGVHRLPNDTLLVPSGTTVYIDGGARVYGNIFTEGVHDVNIFGRGEVHPDGRGAGVQIRCSKNVKVDGIVVSQLPIGQCDLVELTNVKSISYYGWGDGMDVFSSSNVILDGVFCRNSDDCVAVYASTQGYKGGSNNVLVKNATLWADVAHPINVGGHGDPNGMDTVQNITFRNIDILDQAEKQIDYQGCLAINPGDNTLVCNITFENIQIEDFRNGQLVNFRISYNPKYCVSTGRGVRNVLVKDVVYNGTGANLSIIAGYDENHKISDVRFVNLVINDRKITDDMLGKPKWYKTGDMAGIFVGEHVENISFE
ncbi:glycosyl hydrolase family 28 protein [Phocaeicola sp.]|jgi:hypothetical protein|uniref:glycosyl hydrolase family 28 protein n=1 Tax=Phocaeicola sp. TaxID=2773926 RepID=UPI002A8253AB|nr:glycosyl hydrolase family 28 protein [Phocaeicola sp.]